MRWRSPASWRAAAGRRPAKSWRQACCAILALALTAPTAAGARAKDTWIGAWGFPSTAFASAKRAPPQVADFNNVTVRQIVRISADASRIRIRISNEFGDAPMKLGSVHVALAGEDGSILPGSDHALTFSGQATISVPAHAPMLSDPVDWKVPALTKLAISIFLPEDTIPPAHRVSEYVSSPGMFANAERMPGAELVRSGALVSQVEVAGPTARRTVVALGDSITEGFGSTVNAFRGWPDRLAERLNGSRGTQGWSVVDAGINSNRLLHDDPCSGALTRFDRDVLSVPGAAMVIVMEGINDIGYSHTTPAEAVSAEDLIGAYRQLILRAHAHGLTIVGGTIMPYEDSHYYDVEGDRIRRTVNRWIREGGAFDGVIDFDAALRDPAHPAQVRPSWQRGDHLHPTDEGYAAMADAIDLKLFKTR